MAEDKSIYGRYYWTIETHRETIRLHADEVIVENGVVMFVRNRENDKFIMFSVGSGEWRHFYSASVLDGGAPCVEHWDALPENEVKKRTRKAS